MKAAAPPFRLERRSPPGAALQHLARLQLRHAQASLRRGDARGVHEARKACKRLRALLRLVRPALGTARYRVENRRVRDAGRALAALREAEALRATARSLGLPWLARGAAASGADVDRAIGRATRLLRAQARAIGRWPGAGTDRAVLADALADGYRAARRAARQARLSGSALALHEWRKRVKHHRYQCEACASLWPRLRPRVLPLERLGEILGRHHDLDVLAHALAHRPHRLGALEAAPAAARRLRREQRRLAARAHRAGARVFGARPREWRARELAP